MKIRTDCKLSGSGTEDEYADPPVITGTYKFEHLFGPWVGVLAEGAAAGVIGGTMVVMWFLFYDLGSGSNPFRTPAMLGGVILEGARNPAGAAIGSPLVMGYTVLHFAVFVAFGVVAASLAASVDEPLLWAGFLLVF